MFIVTGLSSDSSALLTLTMVGGTKECRWDWHTPDEDLVVMSSHLSVFTKH